jgi:hypothetical protein
MSRRKCETLRFATRFFVVSDMASKKAFNSTNLELSKLARKIMEYGFDAGNLSSGSSIGIPDIAISAILEYYALDISRYCTEQRKIKSTPVANP